MKNPSQVNAPMRLLAWRRCLASLGISLLISGCGTNILHNAADFKAATEADEARKKIDYSAVIQEERAVQDKILGHELSVVNDFAEARRIQVGLPLSEIFDEKYEKMTEKKDLEQQT